MACGGGMERLENSHGGVVEDWRDGGMEWRSEERAVDEAAGVTAWVRSYGGPEGTGLVQLWISRDTPGNRTDVRSVVEYGMR